jgi:hypothetical protein
MLGACAACAYAADQFAAVSVAQTGFTAFYGVSGAPWWSGLMFAALVARLPNANVKPENPLASIIGEWSLDSSIRKVVLQMGNECWNWTTSC